MMQKWTFLVQEIVSDPADVVKPKEEPSDFSLDEVRMSLSLPLLGDYHIFPSSLF